MIHWGGRFTIIIIFFPYWWLSCNKLFSLSLSSNPQLACLSGMDAGISTTGLRVAGVPIDNDEWVQQFVQEKAAAV